MLYLLALFTLVAALAGARLLALDRQRLRRGARRRANLAHQRQWRQHVAATEERRDGAGERSAVAGDIRRGGEAAAIHLIEPRRRSATLLRRSGRALRRSRSG